MKILSENIDSIIIVVYCFLIGIIIAFSISLITRGIYGKFIDALINRGAESGDTALTLDELEIKRNVLLIFALSKKTTLSSIVSWDNTSAEVSKRQYYILPERQIKARGLFGTEKISALSVAAAVLLFVVILILFQYAIPKFF